MWAQLAGGVGLFLLGMSLLTDGLKSLAGDRVRGLLQRFAGHRLSAFATGAITTALIQSSSATSLIVVGLVSAGLATLPQAIAILIGANVGTTATAYLVALVGLKFSVSVVALPLVGVGALARILARGTWGAAANVATGFGLLFVGIDMMQAGMADLAAGLDFGGTGVLGALSLLGIGILMTVLVQSSSAAMATTLAAVATGTIDLESAAYLVIGQNVGTTVTAVLGSLGASSAARRTAYAHVVFNVGAAIPTALAAPWLLDAAGWIAGAGDATTAGPAITLAVFHTLFNVLGAAAFLPWSPTLARLLMRWLPSREPMLTQHLDPRSTDTAAAAGAALDATIASVLAEVLHLVRRRLATDRRPRDDATRLDAIDEALDQASHFMEEARRAGTTPSNVSGRLQALDHLRHMAADLRDPLSLAQAAQEPMLAPFMTRTRDILEHLREGTPADEEFKALGKIREDLRRKTLARLEQRADYGVPDAQRSLEALHWLDRQTWHLRRCLRAMAAPEAAVAGDVVDPPDATA